ncbi:hypothetical protein ABZP36_008632 [Zizania latifolia]
MGSSTPRTCSTPGAPLHAKSTSARRPAPRQIHARALPSLLRAGAPPVRRLLLTGAPPTCRRLSAGTPLTRHLLHAWAPPPPCRGTPPPCGLLAGNLLKALKILEPDTRRAWCARTLHSLYLLF